MNYIEYNNISTFYKDINSYDFDFLNEYFSIELKMNSNEDAEKLFLFLKEKIGIAIKIFKKNNILFNFALTECYLDNNIFIMKGKI